jgi:hypothetical protein
VSAISPVLPLSSGLNSSMSYVPTNSRRHDLSPRRWLATDTAKPAIFLLASLPALVLDSLLNGQNPFGAPPYRGARDAHKGPIDP